MKSIKEHFVVNSKNLKIAYFSINKKPASKKVAIFSHGTGFVAHCFLVPIRKVYSLLKQPNDVCCIAIESTGHGNSDTPTPLSSFEGWNEYAEDVLKVIEQLKEEKVIVEETKVYSIGHSAGGHAHVNASLKKQLFDSMLLYEPIINYQKIDNQIMYDLVSKRKNKFDSKKEIKEYLSQKRLFKNWETEILEDYINNGFKETNDGSFVLKCDPLFEANSYIKAGEENALIWNDLQKLKTNKVIVAGGSLGDFYLQEEHWRKLIKQFSCPSSFKLIENGSHCFPMEDSDRFAKLVVDLIDSSTNNKSNL